MTPCFVLNVAHVKAAEPPVFRDKRPLPNPTWEGLRWEVSLNRPCHKVMLLKANKISRRRACPNKA